MDNNLLLTNYYTACNDLLRAFCKKHNFNYEDARKCWVGGCTGEITCCNDYYYVRMEEIVTDLRENAPKESFGKWYDYSMRCHSIGVNGCNYDSWLRGCPVLPEEELVRMEKSQANIEKLRLAFEKDLERFKEEGF